MMQKERDIENNVEEKGRTLEDIKMHPKYKSVHLLGGEEIVARLEPDEFVIAAELNKLKEEYQAIQTRLPINVNTMTCSYVYEDFERERCLKDLFLDAHDDSMLRTLLLDGFIYAKSINDMEYVMKNISNYLFNKHLDK